VAVLENLDYLPTLLKSSIVFSVLKVILNSGHSEASPYSAFTAIVEDVTNVWTGVTQRLQSFCRVLLLLPVGLHETLTGGLSFLKWVQDSYQVKLSATWHFLFLFLMKADHVFNVCLGKWTKLRCSVFFPNSKVRQISTAKWNSRVLQKIQARCIITQWLL